MKAAKLGFYELVRPLATGGMAEVFLARATGPQGFEKLVALKRILPQFGDDGRLVRAFIDEAKLAAQLDHPHIAQVYDLCKLEEHYCYAMEYIEGRDLAAVLRRAARLGSPLPIALAVQIARAVASALHHAHERPGLGIVHRDVSPTNIVISTEGVVKLLDFGVAKARTSSLQTKVGAIKGKPEYMAPEQAAGAAIDRRADIYALGMVLAELVTGERRPPGPEWRGADSLRPPGPEWRGADSLRSPGTTVPPALAAIIRRALAADRAARHQTARELQVALDDYARSERLEQSTLALADYMRDIFADASGAWIVDEPETTLDEFPAEEAPTRALEQTRRAPVPTLDGPSEPTLAATNVYRSQARTTAKIRATRGRDVAVAIVLGLGLAIGVASGAERALASTRLVRSAR